MPDNIDIFTEIVNRNYEDARRQRATEEIFAIANRPGNEKRKREAARRKQEKQWRHFQDFVFICLQLITLALLVADAAMLITLICGVFFL